MSVRKTYFTALALISLCVTAHAAVISTFDSGDEGWRITGDAQSGSVIPDWYSTGGNPDGYISARDDVQGGTWYFQAGPDFQGDFSSAYGTLLTFDLRQSGTHSQFNNVDVYISGAGTALAFDTSYNPGTDWTGYAVELSELAGWKVNDLNGPAATQQQVQSVLANISNFRIRGEYISGSDVGDLDNVYMVPEPASAILFALGAGSLALRRRRS